MLLIANQYQGAHFVVTFDIILEDDKPVILITRSFPENGEDDPEPESWTIDAGFVFQRSTRNKKVVTNVGMKFAEFSGICSSVWGVEGTGNSPTPYWLWDVSDEDVIKLHQLENTFFEAELGYN